MRPVDGGKGGGGGSVTSMSGRGREGGYIL